LSDSRPSGDLSLSHDPKTAWALANRALFPVDVNSAERETLLRVPGLGVRVVNRILSSRRQRRLRWEDLKAMGAILKRARHFVVAANYTPLGVERTGERLDAEISQMGAQQSLF
jgi:predicted DNA-binding helix-hairpin-helix protein